jgi:uncharacterized membrane protein YbaN (DUF454 family)
MKRILRYLIGLTFTILGIIGCFLPVLQGILFLIIGVIILSPEVPAVQKMLSILEKKYPEIFRKAKGLIKHKKIIDEK